MRFSIICIGLFFQVLFNIGLAQGAEPTGAVVDYGPAFERLIQLGLPDAKGAKYVKLTVHTNSRVQGRGNQYSDMGGSVNSGAKGNAWLLPSSKEGEKLFELIHDGYGKVKIKKKKKRGRLLRILVGPEKKSEDGSLKGDWVEQNVAEDTQKILKTLEKERGKNKKLDPSSWEYSLSSAMWCSRILVDACHMYRAGYVKEANQITAKLMALAPKPVLVIDQVVNSLASQSYNQLAAQFFKNKDWVAYRDGSKKMLEKYTRGWKFREGVEILVTQLDLRIKGAKPELKQLKGVTIKPEALGILNALLKQKEDIIVDAPMMWIFGGDVIKKCAKNPNFSYYLRPSKQEWVKKFTQLQMDAVIALASAVTDQSLMTSRLGVSQDGYYNSWSGYSSSSIDPLALYNSLSRPCSRGEIAQKLLQLTLPDTDNSLSSLNAEELQSIAHQWWLKHKSDSQPELAKHFLEEGSDNQKRLAIIILIKLGEASSSKIVEDYILSSGQIGEQLTNVTLYLKERRGNARSFYDRFAKALKEEAEGVDESDLSWELRDAGGVDKYLKKLKIYVNDVSAEKILADMRSGKIKGTEGLEMLKATGSSGDEFVKILPNLISVARHQKTMEEQVGLLNAISGLLSNHYYSTIEVEENSENDATGDKEYEASLAKMLEKSKEDWQWFLKQTDAVKDPKILRGASSLAEYAGWQMEGVYFPQNMGMLYQLNGVMSQDELWAFGLTRAQSVLKDGVDAYFPDPKSVTKSRRKAIRGELNKMSAKEILHYKKNLTLDEKLAWNEILDEYGENLPAGILEMSKLVTRVDWAEMEDRDKELKRKLEALTYGKVVSQSMIDGLLDLMLEYAASHHDCVVYLQYKGGKDKSGFSLQVVRQVARGGWILRLKNNALEEVLDDLRSKKLKKISSAIIANQRDLPAALHRDSPVKEDGKRKKELSAAFFEKIKNGEGVGLTFFSETSEALLKREAKESDKNNF